MWLFDSEDPIRRRTFGFRLHAGGGPEEEPPHRLVRRPLWPPPLAKAMFFAATEAWDRRMSRTTGVRTVSVPTGDVSTLDFRLDEEKQRYLYDSGYEATDRFLATQRDSLNSYGREAAGPAEALTPPGA